VSALPSSYVRSLPYEPARIYTAAVYCGTGGWAITSMLIAHVGCAYYSHRLMLPDGKVVEEQIEDLRKAQWTVERIVPGIQVERYLLRVAGREVGFEQVGG
jgi:hypothetical protein